MPCLVAEKETNHVVMFRMHYKISSLFAVYFLINRIFKIMKNTSLLVFVLLILFSCSEEHDRLNRETIQVCLGVSFASGETRSTEGTVGCMDLDALKEHSVAGTLTANVTVQYAGTSESIDLNDIPVKFRSAENGFFLNMIELPKGSNTLMSIEIQADGKTVYQGIDEKHVLAPMVTTKLPVYMDVDPEKLYEVYEFSVSVVCSQTIEAAEFGFGYLGLEIYASYQLDFFVGSCEENGKLIAAEGTLRMSHLKRQNNQDDWQTVADEVYQMNYPATGNKLPSFAFGDLVNIDDDLEGYRFEFIAKGPLEGEEGNVSETATLTMTVKELLSLTNQIKEGTYRYAYIDLCEMQELIPVIYPR